MAGLKSIVEEPNTKGGRAFEIAVLVLIIASLASFSIETLPNLSDATRSLLEGAEVLIVILFTVEYILRIYVSDRKMSYIFSFFGFIDLMAILPFYLSLGVDLRSVRILRIMRLFQLLKIVRYNRAIRRFHRALGIAKEEIILFGLCAVMVLFLSAVGIYYFENEAQPTVFASVFHCLWWAVCTLSTVGYGDAYPITPGGKAFTFLVIAVGVGIVTVPAGLVASALSRARELEEIDPTAESEIGEEKGI